MGILAETLLGISKGFVKKYLGDISRGTSSWTIGRNIRGASAGIPDRIVEGNVIITTIL